MKTSALTYFAVVLGWTWLFWGASVWWGGSDDPSQSIVFLVGGAGPFLVAVALTHLRESPADRRSFWVRSFDPRPLGVAWLAVALLVHPAIVAASFAVDVALGGALPPLSGQVSSVFAMISLLFFVFWFGPLPEEMGWRGFALDRLQARMPALQASLVLGSVWALWHVPLFFVPGSFQAELGFGSTRSWIFLFSMVPLSVIMTWVYNNTERSTFSAVLVHYTGNLCGALLPKSDRVAAIEVGFLVLVAGLLVLGWGGRTLTKPAS